jgi:tRNA dimethylallyltransferase
MYFENIQQNNEQFVHKIVKKHKIQENFMTQQHELENQNQKIDFIQDKFLKLVHKIAELELQKQEVTEKSQNDFELWQAENEKLLIENHHLKSQMKNLSFQKDILVVGGTGLYFNALTDGLVKIPNIPMKIRNKIRLMQKKLSQTKFYNKLLKLDPLIKNKIDKNDIQRSIRAYEIKYQTKKSIIEWFKKTKNFFSSDEFIKLYIDYPRESLINRINLRVEGMFKDGVIEEVKRFNKIKVKKENSSNKVIGIKEITNLLNKQCTLDQAKELIAIKTRQYAKRQATWARGQMQSWQKINPNNLSLTLKKLK